MDLREISKRMTNWEHSASLDAIQAGALVRIADSLGKIERMLYLATPEGKAEAADEEKERVAFKLRRAKYVWLMSELKTWPPHPRGIGEWTMQHLARDHIEDGADLDRPESWSEVWKNARKKKGELARQWLSLRFPGHDWNSEIAGAAS